MKVLTKKEELILLAILNLREDAYLIAIQNHLSVVIKKRILLTSVHVPLTRLEKRGLIQSEFGEATSVRGGRRKKVYRLTPQGFKVLAECKRINDALWGIYNEFTPQNPLK
jgi:DNA-binding PadR family transcriptional regulator